MIECDECEGTGDLEKNEHPAWTRREKPEWLN